MTLPMYDPGSGLPMYGDSMLPLACDEEVCCPEAGCDCEEGGLQADFNWSNTAGDPCTFNFEDISVPGTCGDIVMWEWFRTGMEEPFSTAQNPSLFFPGCGPWNVRLRVTDEEGCIDEVTQTVNCCCCENDGPTANFSYMQTDNDPCCFEFTNTSSPGACGDVSYLWDFGDGDTSTSENPSHCYDGAGPWDVTLTVTDTFGCADAAVGEVMCADAEACVEGEDTQCCYPAGQPGEGSCLCILDTIPASLRVTFSGMDGLCSFYNRSFIVPRLPSTTCFFQFLGPVGPGQYQETVEVQLGCQDIRVSLNVKEAGGQPNRPLIIYGATALAPINDSGEMNVFFGDCSTLSVTLGDLNTILQDTDCFVFGVWQSGVTILVEAI